MQYIEIILLSLKYEIFYHFMTQCRIFLKNMKKAANLGPFSNIGSKTLKFNFN